MRFANCEIAAALSAVACDGWADAGAATIQAMIAKRLILERQ